MGGQIAAAAQACQLRKAKLRGYKQPYCRPLKSADLIRCGARMKTIAILLAAVFTVALAGCNTVKGVGQDIQKAGEKIEDSAKKK